MRGTGFLSTPSARRATTMSDEIKTTDTMISIHALREEGDTRIRRWRTGWRLFLSTPSARRATRARLPICKCWQHFYPRPPRGGRPRTRESAGSTKNFYPRPPRGGRRSPPDEIRQSLPISIHALREEGDSKNGEKHLRFCFIIKRSAQIWKSLSKNIRKNSCDLHRTA